MLICSYFWDCVIHEKQYKMVYGILNNDEQGTRVFEYLGCGFTLRI